MSVYPRGKSFRCKFRVDGRDFLQTFSTLEAAEKWEADTRHALKYGKPLPMVTNGRASSGGKLETLGKAYSHTRHTVWDRARGSHSQIIYGRQAVEYFGKDKPLAEIDELAIRDWASALFAEGAASGTVNRKLSALSKVMSEVPGFSKPKFPRYQELSKEIRFLTRQEEQVLLDTLYKWGQEDLRLFTQWQLDTGLRLGETLALTWDHFAWDDYGNATKVTAWHTKGGKPRTIPLTKRASRVIQGLRGNDKGPFRHMQAGKGLSRALRNRWNKVNSHLGLNRRIHDLRHTCASRLVQQGIDLLRVKDWMGHKDLTTTLIYAHLAPHDLDVCVAALDKSSALDPRSVEVGRIWELENGTKEGTKGTEAAQSNRPVASVQTSPGPENP